MEKQGTFTPILVSISSIPKFINVKLLLEEMDI